MADCCCTPPPLNPDPHRDNAAYRRVLCVVLAINTVMFLVEIGAGLAAGSHHYKLTPSTSSVTPQTTRSALSWSIGPALSGSGRLGQRRWDCSDCGLSEQ
jgi:hypothetical protein